MYSRNYGNGGRYNPPPGYVGSAFPDPEVKLHIGDGREDAKQDGQTNVLTHESHFPERRAEKTEGSAALEELIHALRGKIGTEELIILLVMLLTASEGIGAETLILVAVLLAGNKRSD